MRQSIFEYVGNLDTLIAVVIGAILATSGALVAELIQDRLNRKRRERDAARFFGEILSSVDRILDSAFTTKAVGDPWGPVTRRLYKMALRETSVYERNRERLFDIRDIALRTRIHVHVLTESFPMEAILDYCQDRDAARTALDEDGLAPERTEKLRARLAEAEDMLDRAFTALRTEHAKTDAICAELEKLGGVRFDAVAAAATANTPAPAPAPAATTAAAPQTPE